MKFNKQLFVQKLQQMKLLLMQNKSAAAKVGGVAAVGAGLIISANLLYRPQPVSQPNTTTAPKTETQKATPSSVAEMPSETAASEAVWTPSLEELNLAHFFPEDADQSDKTQSLGGQAFKELMTQDEIWMNDIYDYADITPAQLAKRLGKDPSSVMGGYNPKDDRHDPKDSSTWSVNTFKNIRMTAQDGDGNAITPYSNVLEIMSMANTYTYYQNAEDYDLFISYAKELWKHSHSYKVGMSDVYYCAGCLSEEAERQEMEALEEEAKAEEMGISQENPLSLSTEENPEDEEHLQDPELSLNGPHEEEAVPAAVASTAIIAGAHRAAKAAEAESKAAEEAAKASSAAAESIPESSSAVITAPVQESTEEAESTATQTTAPETTAPVETSQVLTAGSGTVFAEVNQESSASQTTAEVSESSETLETSAPEESAAAETTASGESQATEESIGNTESESAAEETAATPADADPAAVSAEEKPAKKAEDSGKTSAGCPGHVDLIIRMKIIGLDEQENSLFTADQIGNSKENIKTKGWPGWNEETRTAAKQLSSLDWFEKYGLTVSNLSPGNPLSQAEINAYMATLPLNLSQTRKNLIRFALESVGRVPYYWGGKPSAPDYVENRFGILTSPDYKGRVLKGLDCSGWINWVYWSVTGKRLPYESTSGLAVLGRKISRKDLQPGDIIVRTGTEAHVIMFLGWTPDGRIQCIHESSSPVNNVTVAVRDANWPYYRNLID